ncbi:hypothetical protein AaE_004879, partial [Aphanomyces astaci]
MLSAQFTPTEPKSDIASQCVGMEHTTVCVNKYTLQFEDANLEASFQAFSHTRKKTLWLRSLIPAAMEPPCHTARASAAYRHAVLDVLSREMGLGQGGRAAHVRVGAHAMLHQWDALFVVFGLSFYTIPKVTPLGFVYSTMGSTITMVVYFAIALFCRPPPDK